MILKTMLERSDFNKANALEDSITGFDFAMNGSAAPRNYSVQMSSTLPGVLGVLLVVPDLTRTIPKRR